MSKFFFSFYAIFLLASQFSSSTQSPSVELRCSGNEATCIPYGSFCWWPSKECCCPNGCLGMVIGWCWSNSKSTILYRVYGENDIVLERGSVISTRVSEAQLVDLVNRLGNVTMMMEVETDLGPDRGRLISPRVKVH